MQPKEMQPESIRRLMRQHKVTIAALASRMAVTQKRVREYRTAGAPGFLAYLAQYRANN